MIIVLLLLVVGPCIVWITPARWAVWFVSANIVLAVAVFIYMSGGVLGYGGPAMGFSIIIWCLILLTALLVKSASHRMRSPSK